MGRRHRPTLVSRSLSDPGRRGISQGMLFVVLRMQTVPRPVAGWPVVVAAGIAASAVAFFWFLLVIAISASAAGYDLTYGGRYDGRTWAAAADWLGPSWVSSGLVAAGFSVFVPIAAARWAAHGCELPPQIDMRLDGRPGGVVRVGFVVTAVPVLSVLAWLAAAIVYAVACDVVGADGARLPPVTFVISVVVTSVLVAWCAARRPDAPDPEA